MEVTRLTLAIMVADTSPGNDGRKQPVRVLQRKMRGFEDDSTATVISLSIEAVWLLHHVHTPRGLIVTYRKDLMPHIFQPNKGPQNKSAYWITRN